MTSTTEKATGSVLRIAILGAVALAFAGALFLYAVRGQAMLLDLASGIAGVLCL